MTKDNGGPVHPTLKAHYEDSWTSQGITLRDYFATHATESDVAHFIMKGHSEDHISINSLGVKSIHEIQAMFTLQEAKFRYADAMIEARNK